MKPLFYLYPDFLGKTMNRELYKLAITKNGRYSQSRTSRAKMYPEWRKSKVIYHDQFREFEELMKEKLLGRFDEICEQLKIPTFEIDFFEVQLTSHNDGEYFKWHRDNSTLETASRTITFVYYFHAIPKKYSGGELIIYDGEKEHVVVPQNDMIVVFHSGRKHEVRQVNCPSGRFESGRFTLNGWIRSQTARRVDHRYFGYNMFVPKAAKIGVQMATSK